MSAILQWLFVCILAGLTVAALFEVFARGLPLLRRFWPLTQRRLFGILFALQLGTTLATWHWHECLTRTVDNMNALVQAFVKEVRTRLPCESACSRCR